MSIGTIISREFVAGLTKVPVRDVRSVRDVGELFEIHSQHPTSTKVTIFELMVEPILALEIVAAMSSMCGVPISLVSGVWSIKVEFPLQYGCRPFCVVTGEHNLYVYFVAAT